MSKAKKAGVIVAVLPDRVGLLAEIGGLLSGAAVNIEAIRAYRAGENAQFIVMVDNIGKARKALEGTDAEIREEEVTTVELPHKPGQLAAAAKKLADDGVNIEYSWCNAFSGPTATWILKTDNPSKTVAALNR
jgi:hypothetical protein